MTHRIAEPVHTSDTEAAIVEAGRDLLAERGLEGLSMRAVAGRVGVSATAIYNYFENKQALLDRVVLSGWSRFEAYLQAAVADRDRGSLERLYALGGAYIRFALENQEYFKVLFTMRTEHPRDIAELPAEGGYLMLREAVEEAMGAGRLRREDPDLVALYLWTHVHGLVTLFMACRVGSECCDDGEEPDPVELFARFRGLMSDGLRAIRRPGRPPAEEELDGAGRDGAWG